MEKMVQEIKSKSYTRYIRFEADKSDIVKLLENGQLIYLSCWLKRHGFIRKTHSNKRGLIKNIKRCPHEIVKKYQEGDILETEQGVYLFIRRGQHNKIIVWDFYIDDEGDLLYYADNNEFAYQKVIRAYRLLGKEKVI
jgi:hypothetical protein